MAAVQIYQPDANRIIHTASVDFLSRTSMGKPVHLVQYDTRLPILAVSTRYGAQQYKVPDTAEVSIRVGKKDGTFVIANALGCDATRTTLYFEMTQQMTVLYGEINPIIEVKVSGQLAGSSAIQVMIDRNPVQEDDIESTTEFKQLEQYVSEASTSAAEAKKSENASAASATKSENFAQQSGTSASQSATSAAASAASAKESSGYADNSKKSADASAASAVESSGYADDSEASAGKSAASATASETSAQKSATSASQSATSAAASQKSADDSQDSADASAASAGESASSASASEASAQRSQASAEASAASATESSGYADNSAASAAESSGYADNSAASATASQKSADASAASAVEAAKSAEEIKGWDKLAESYVHGNTGVRENEATDNGAYYLEQAKLVSQSLQGALLPIASVNFAELETQQKQSGYMYNIKDAFTTNENFREGAGIHVAAGANVYWTADGNWDILTPSTVVGVKGSENPAYKTGNVSLGYSDVGALGKNETAEAAKVLSPFYAQAPSATSTRLRIITAPPSATMGLTGRETPDVYVQGILKWLGTDSSNLHLRAGDVFLIKAMPGSHYLILVMITNVPVTPGGLPNHSQGIIMQYETTSLISFFTSGAVYFSGVVYSSSNKPSPLDIRAADRVIQTQYQVTLPVTGWSTTYPYTNRVALAASSAGLNAFVTGLVVSATVTEADYKAQSKAFGMLMSNAAGTATENGYITFKAYKKPAVNITVLVQFGYSIS